jgi:5-methylthioadenosine/S-adenosylhomocysteine deaminase
MNLLIHDTTLITRTKKIIREGAIVIEDTKITDIGKSSDLKRKHGRGYEKIDARGQVVTPGFINTHQHAAMSLLRGYADDLPLQEWLEEWIWPIEKQVTAHDIYVGALLTAVESIMSGTTTVNTMYHYTPEENEAKAFADAGLRGVVGHVCFSWRKKEDKTALEDLTKRWHNKTEGLIRTSVDPHAPYTVDPEYMKELKAIKEELNEKYGSKKAPIILHTHVAETSDEPKNAPKRHNGFTWHRQPCSNNSADMFDVMKTIALVHKGVNKDPTLMPAEQVLEMATIQGAKTLSWETEIGSIEIGKKADLAIINFNKPHLRPLYSETSHLVYAAKPSDIETVIINGEIVMENRKLTTLDVGRVMQDAEKAKTNLLKKLAPTLNRHTVKQHKRRQA